MTDRANESPAQDAGASVAPPQPGVVDIVKKLTVDDFKNVGQYPCARSSLLYGIGTGFGAGVLRFAYKGQVLSASNYAVASFCAVSLVSWEVCRYQLKKQRSLPTSVGALPPSSAPPS
ncbi:hypothetical protein H9P43_008284 [Blastocladiella emersonii ATCC 22665]|nr:hypothetical protein H9P43_008284 [Blastocladiella emersonii ATCC 22665]